LSTVVAKIQIENKKLLFFYLIADKEIASWNR